MSRRAADLLIEDIWEAIEKIERYTKGMTSESFEEDEKTADAVVRNLEIIGEAANRLPADFKEKHSEIEWTKIVGLRHRIVHEYFGVDQGIIWQIIQSDLPMFRRELKRIRDSQNRRWGRVSSIKSF
jgi:uncharacterized protein with HEPN domain